MNRTTRVPRAVRRRVPTLRLAALCIATLPLTVAAGPTIEFGQGSTLNFTYGLQIWNETRSFTSSTNPASMPIFLPAHSANSRLRRISALNFISASNANFDS